MKKIRVLIVDDHYMVVEGIRSLMQDDPGIEFIGAASSSSSCLLMMSQQQPDVVLMDVQLSDDDGIVLCKQVITEHPGVVVLGLSTFNKPSIIERMMNNGASGYLLKNASQKELSEAIRTAAQGKIYLSTDIQHTLRQNADREAPVLTRREKEILTLIAEGHTNQEIAGLLFISAATVDTHRKNLLLKLKAKNTAALVKIAYEQHIL